MVERRGALDRRPGKSSPPKPSRSGASRSESSHVITGLVQNWERCDRWMDTFSTKKMNHFQRFFGKQMPFSQT